MISLTVSNSEAETRENQSQLRRLKVLGELFVARIVSALSTVNGKARSPPPLGGKFFGCVFRKESTGIIKFANFFTHTTFLLGQVMLGFDLSSSPRLIATAVSAC